MEIVIGMLGALVGVGLFIFGFYLGKQMCEEKTRTTVAENTDEEMAEIRAERERLIEEQKAFHTLMDYNANVAYGLTGNPLTQEKSW